MADWAAFSVAAPDIAAAGVRLFAREEVALLATVAPARRPRIHPFVPKIVEGRLVAFILASSPKFRDLARGLYAIHATPGPEDEEFMISGRARVVDDDAGLRARADLAMGFATGPADANHVLHEFGIDRALWTRWLDFGTADHRPEYHRWRQHA